VGCWAEAAVIASRAISRARWVIAVFLIEKELRLHIDLRTRRAGNPPRAGVIVSAVRIPRSAFIRADPQ
jgi:hypothetical protein